MNPSTRERWRSVENLIDAALERPPEERDAYLRDAAGGDSFLYREAAKLLRAGQAPLPFLREPHGQWREPPPPLVDSPAGSSRSRIGPYRILEEIGRGGMGTVFLAERADFGKRVALKLLRSGLHLDAYLVRRFLEERRILATLDHPNIARLLDGGITGDGVPFLVMEYVDGEPIDRYCDRRRLPVERRLALFRHLCEAVEYAHRNLVVHRDLKPTNVLVTGAGEVKLLDFGIAKLLSAEPGPEAVPTRTGMRLFTPEYASPEQVSGGPVTTASDVFALGILLYELLTGRRPFRSTAADPLAAGRAVVEQEPLRPSLLALRTADGATSPPDVLARCRGTTPARLARHLAGDIDAILLQALRKETERRYATAEQLRADLDRRLAGLPVSARPDSCAYRVRKFVGRHRVAVAAAAGLLVLLAGFGVVMRRQVERIEHEREQTANIAVVLEAMLALADPATTRGETLPSRVLLDRVVEQLRRQPVDDPELRADLLASAAHRYIGLGAYEHARPLVEEALAIRRRALGPEHPDLVRSLLQRGLLLRHLGHYRSAEDSYREALAMHARRPDADAAAGYLGLNGLAFVLRGAGRFDEATALYRQLIERARLQGREPAAVDVQGLAASLFGLGNLAGAERGFREALELVRRREGASHPEHFVISYNLGELLHERGALRSADSLYRATLEADRQVRGDRHPLRAVGLFGWGEVRRDLGDLHGADSLYLLALELGGVDPVGRERPRTASILVGRAVLFLRQGRAEDAEPLLRRALRARERTLATEHWHIAEARLLLGAALSALGRYREAEPLVLAAHAALRDRFGAAHPRTLRAREQLHRYVARSGGPRPVTTSAPAPSPMS